MKGVVGVEMIYAAMLVEKATDATQRSEGYAQVNGQVNTDGDDVGVGVTMQPSATRDEEDGKRAQGRFVVEDKLAMGWDRVLTQAQAHQQEGAESLFRRRKKERKAHSFFGSP